MTNHVMTDDRAQVAAAKADRVMEPCTLVLFGASGDLAALRNEFGGHAVKPPKCSIRRNAPIKEGSVG